MKKQEGGRSTSGRIFVKICNTRWRSFVTAYGVIGKCDKSIRHTFEKRAPAWVIIRINIMTPSMYRLKIKFRLQKILKITPLVIIYSNGLTMQQVRASLALQPVHQQRWLMQHLNVNQIAKWQPQQLIQKSC